MINTHKNEPAHNREAHRSRKANVHTYKTKQNRDYAQRNRLGKRKPESPIHRTRRGDHRESMGSGG
jgi:hypothetical protein